MNLIEENTVEIIADIIGETSFFNCPECCYYCMDACGSGSENGSFYVDYSCEECYRHSRLRWVQKSEDGDDDLINVVTGDSEGLILKFDEVRKYILRAKGKKFVTIKALLDYCEVDCDKTIPEIYNDLKKNYIDVRNYKLYKLLRCSNLHFV